MGNLLTFGVASMFQHATAGYETSGAPPEAAVRAVLCHTPDGILEGGKQMEHPAGHTCGQKGANAMAKSQLLVTELMWVVVTSGDALKWDEGWVRSCSDWWCAMHCDKKLSSFFVFSNSTFHRLRDMILLTHDLSSTSTDFAVDWP